jgi:hypothetical protein
MISEISQIHPDMLRKLIEHNDVEGLIRHRLTPAQARTVLQIALDDGVDVVLSMARAAKDIDPRGKGAAAAYEANVASARPIADSRSSPRFKIDWSAVIIVPSDSGMDPASRLEKASELTSIGQYEKARQILSWFFENRDFRKAIIPAHVPNVAYAVYDILNESGIAHLGLGDASTAIELHTRNSTLSMQARDFPHVGAQHQRLAEAFLHVRELHTMSRAADLAVSLARDANDKANLRDSLILYGTANKDRFGWTEAARKAMTEAQELSKQVGPATDIWGLMLADFHRERHEYREAVEQVEIVLATATAPHVRAQALLLKAEIAQDVLWPSPGVRELHDEALALAKETTAYPLIRLAESIQSSYALQTDPHAWTALRAKDASGPFAPSTELFLSEIAAGPVNAAQLERVETMIRWLRDYASMVGPTGRGGRAPAFLNPTVYFGGRGPVGSLASAWADKLGSLAGAMRKELGLDLSAG